MNRASLAASGWITDSPLGNRLRWTWPTAVPPPAVVQVQRAPLLPGSLETSPTPRDWWTVHPTTISLSDAMPLVTWDLQRPAQEIEFTFGGPVEALCTVRRSADRALIQHRLLVPGEFCSVRAADIGSLSFIAKDVDLLDVRTLDLTGVPDLDWEVLAEIRSPGVVSDSLDAALTRLSGFHPADMHMLDSSAWETMRRFALGERGPTESGDELLPSPPERVASMAASRFWVALLLGSGFVDGPATTVNDLDSVDSARMLSAPMDVAYRVVDPAEATQPSNVVVSPGRPAAPLPTPQPPQIGRATVTLIESANVYRAGVTTGLELGGPPAIGAELDLTFVSPDGAVLANDTAEYLLGQPKDASPRHELTRHIDLADVEAQVRARARTLDGWDRASPWSPWSVATDLDVVHDPEPPWFASATVTPTGVELDRAATNWSPDVLVAAAAGRLTILRRVVPPIDQPVVVQRAPESIDESTLSLNVTGLASHEEARRLIGGHLVTATTAYEIRDAQSASLLTLATFRDAAGVAAIPNVRAGDRVTVRQRTDDPALWTQITSFPAVGFPRLVQVTDPWDHDDEHVLRTYCARINFVVAGRSMVGRLGRPVVAVRRPPRLPLAPAFSAVAVGSRRDGTHERDYFGRTLVRLTLLDEPRPDEFFTVSWAETDGEAVPDFGATATVGSFGRLQPSGSHLIEALHLPIPIPRPIPWQAESKATNIVIGLRVTAADGSFGPCTTAPLMLSS